MTPIPLDEAITSLSAILLDETYYEFIKSGRREVNGLPWVGEDRLIPLKAIAWLELAERKKQGFDVDARDVRKHLVDVLRLSQLLTLESRISITGKISDDLNRFLEASASDNSIDPKALNLGNVTVAELLNRGSGFNQPEHLVEPILCRASGAGTVSGSAWILSDRGGRATHSARHASNTCLL